MRTCIYLMIATAISIFVASSVNAAQISVEQYTSSGRHYLFVDGNLEARDRFLIRAKLDDAVEAGQLPATGFDLVLNSPGGSGEAMKSIAEWVVEKQAVTVVFNGDTCYSACAVIWAHGAEKWAQNEAEIGFHVSSVAMLPEAIERLNGFQAAYGWAGIQQMMQDRYAEDLRYYKEMPVASPMLFVANIALASGGYYFWMLTPEEDYIIGGVRRF